MAENRNTVTKKWPKIKKKCGKIRNRVTVTKIETKNGKRAGKSHIVWEKSKKK